MSSITFRAVSFIHKKYDIAYLNIQKAKTNSYKKVTSTLENLSSKAKTTLSKIRNFFLNNKELIVFSALQAIAFFHGPLRFLAAGVVSFFLKKADYKSTDPIITPFSYTLNIIGFIGVILEKTICPACDPSFYLAPCLNGIAFTNTAYNYYQSKNSLDN